MNTIKTFVTFALIASLTIGSIMAITPAFAAKSSGSNGLEKADENVHENAPKNDVTFHEGLCQGGHSTEALEEVTDGKGCDALDSPGSSGEHRQD